VKHTLNYNGEKITMLAMGIPLKNGKHVIAYYEFSKPVQGVKTRAFLWNVEDKTVKTEAVTTNGAITPTSTCRHERSSDSDCDIFSKCEDYCCAFDGEKAALCCGPACISLCLIPGNYVGCILCIALWCPTCERIERIACYQWGSYCLDATPP